MKPSAPGSSVTLQVRYEGRNSWKTIGHALLSSSSRFKFQDRVGSVRERKYRVVKPAGPNRAAGHSPSLKVTVFGWRDLTSLEPATYANLAETTYVDIGGVRYPNSLRSYYFGPQSPNVSIEYNLNRDCKSFGARPDWTTTRRPQAPRWWGWPPTAHPGGPARSGWPSPRRSPSTSPTSSG